MAVPISDVRNSMKSRWETFRKRLNELSRYFIVTPVSVVLIVIGLTLVIAILIDRSLESTRSQTLDKILKQNELSVTGNLKSYAQIVKSGVGRVNSGPVDRASWAKFMETYNIRQNFPAISQITLTQVVTPEAEPAVLATLSEQYQRPVSIITRSSEPAADILVYATPETENTLNNIGFDLYSQAPRREALNKATDSGEITITDKLKFIRNAQNNDTIDVPAFFMYAPYYDQSLPTTTVEERRNAIRGHVAAAFRADDVFKSALSNVDKQHVAIHVYMGKETNEDLLYTQSASQATGPRTQKVQQISIYGQTFTIRYDFDTNFIVAPSQQRAPFATLVFGVFVALLTGIVTFFFLRDRHHRVMFEKEREVAHAKDELLSLASHQLRTPATGVKQYMGMVLQGFAGDITAVQREFLTKAYKSNERQLHVINDILHLAKLDLGRIVLAKKDFDLSEMVHDVVEEQSQDMQAAGLKVHLKLLKKAPIYADDHVLRMVVENIVSNAIKYTDPNGKITIRLQSKEGQYRLSITDTGVGIARADIPRLFKQFSRLTNSRSHLVPGTGVGLYLARHLTMLHDGNILVTSTVGKGSTFTVLLPITSKKM